MSGEPETIPGALCRDALYVQPDVMAAALARWAWRPDQRDALAAWLHVVACELESWTGSHVHALPEPDPDHPSAHVIGTTTNHAAIVPPRYRP